MKKKTIIFVDPPGWQGAVNGNAAFPNAGIAYLATALKSSQWEIIVADMNNSQAALDNFSMLVENNKPTIIGFSCKTSTFRAAKELALQIRCQYKDTIKLIFGGPHITLNYEELSNLQEDFADILFVGEGEMDLPAICDYLISNENKVTLRNGTIKDSSKIKVYIPDKKIDIEDLAFPDYSLFDNNVLEYLKKNYPLFTSRGCPYGCIYCTVPLINGRNWRSRSVKNIIDELLYAKEKYGITGFQIVDDSWNVNMDRCKEMCREMINRKMNLSWYCPNGIRADQVDKELADLMFESGCKQVSVGLESGNPEVFEKINKGTTLEKIKKGIKILQEANLKVSAFFIIGLPGDNPQRVADSVNLIKCLKINALFNILIPYLHTEVHKQIKKDGRFLLNQENGLHFSNDLRKIKPTFEWNYFSAYQMKKCYIKAHLELGWYFSVIKRRDRWRYLELIYVFLKYYPTGLLKVIKQKLNAFF